MPPAPPPFDPAATDLDLFGEPVYSPPKLDRTMLHNGLCATLKDISLDDLVAMLYSPFEAVVDFSRLCLDENAGQKISLLFNPHRLDTATCNGPSILSAMRNDSYLDGLARASSFKNGLVRELLYQVLQLGVNGVQYVNEFPPHVARKIYVAYKAKTILDPCAGWGGRMIGAASVGAFYHGFEPSTRTFNGLVKLGNFLKSFNNGFGFMLNNIPFEDSTLTDTYDLALTSPPYFDTELYSDENTQAMHRWPTWHEFASGFYLPMVEHASAACRHGLVLNIGSRRHPMRSFIERSVPIEILDWVSLAGNAGLGKENSDGEIFIRIAHP